MKERGPVELIETMERRYRRMRRFQEWSAQFVLSLAMSTGAYGAAEAFRALSPDDTLPHD